MNPNELRTAALRLFVTTSGCFVAGLVTAWVLDSWAINLLGFDIQDVLRNGFSLGYFALLGCLFVPGCRPMRPGILVLVLILAQFYQVALGWDFVAGALSPYRLLPFIVCGIAMLSWLPAEALRLSRLEGSAWITTGSLAVIGWIANAERSQIGIAAVFFLAIFIPLLLVTIRHFIRSCGSEAQASLFAGCFGGFVALGLGTLTVIQFASGLRLGGVEGLLGTRNVSDFNLIIAYLTLLWPFAARVSDAFGPAAVSALTLLFLVVCVMGLSRVGIVIGPVLIVAVLWSQYRKAPFKLAQVCVCALVFAFVAWQAIPNRQSLEKVWLARLNVSNLANISDVLNRVRPGGEDSHDRDRLRLEALRLFRMEPLVGHGFGGFHKSSTLGFNDAHSLTFTALAEHGLIGLMALYAGLATLALKLLRRITLGVHRAPVAVPMMISFLAWIAIVHSVGGNLLMLAEAGFAVNALNALLLGLYALTCATCPVPTEEPQ